MKILFRCRSLLKAWDELIIIFLMIDEWEETIWKFKGLVLDPDGFCPEIGEMKEP